MIRPKSSRQLCAALLLLCLTVLLTQCRRRPDAVLSEDRMKEVTKDIVVARAYLDHQGIREDSLTEAYYRSVLERHDLTREQYDSSLAWYGTNLPLLTKIQKRVSEELREESDLLDTLYQDSIRREGLTYEGLPGLWSGKSRVLLDGDQQLYIATTELTSGEVAGGDTLDFGLRLPLAPDSTERLVLRLFTITADSCVVSGETHRLTPPDGERIRLSFVLPSDTTADASNRYRLLLTYRRLSETRRPRPLLLDSISLTKREAVLPKQEPEPEADDATEQQMVLEEDLHELPADP